LLSDEALEALAGLFLVMEATGRLPKQLNIVLLALFAQAHWRL
jgi:hypothetical protein